MNLNNLKGTLLPFFIVLLAVYCLATAVRYRQHTHILENPLYSHEGQTVLVSMDGYRWLRYAKSYEGGQDSLSGITEQAKVPPFMPMLSRLISISDLPKEEAGSLLAVFLSSLFVFPLGYFFYLCGFGAAGIGASVTGSMGLIYFARTTAFQPDTDMLNLFFPFMIILMIKLTERRVYLFSAMAGLFSLVHYYWYFHSGFTAVWFLLLGAYLYAEGRRGRILVYALAVFALCSGVYPLLHGFYGLREFFSAQHIGGASVFVAENAVHPIAESLGLLTGYWQVSAVGLVLSVFMFRRVWSVLPVFLLGCLMFFKGEKYGIYIAPFVGAGIGFGVWYLLKRLQMSCVLIYVFTASLCLLAVRPYLGQMPAPAVSKEVFGAVKRAEIPEGADVVVSWSYGFLVEYLKNVRCSADGATQFKETSALTERVIKSVNIDRGALNRLYRGRDMYVMLFKSDGGGDKDGRFYADFKCSSTGDCGIMHINAENGTDKLIMLGNVQLTDIEQKRTLYGKISPGRGNIAVFDEKNKDSLFGRGFIIGESDIDCLSRIYHAYPHLAVYRAGVSCF